MTLLHESDAHLAHEIVAAFERDDIEVARVTDKAALFAELEMEGPKVLIMDHTVDDPVGCDLIARLRADRECLPILVMSSLAAPRDRIKVLRAGADDYLVKPFAMNELLARIHALKRRAFQGGASLSVGPLVMDVVCRTVRRLDREIDLTPREFHALEFLMRNAGQTVTRATLLERVWKFHPDAETNVVDVCLGKLRRKVDIKNDDKLIVSVRGLGFKLECDMRWTK